MLKGFMGFVNTKKDEIPAVVENTVVASGNPFASEDDVQQKGNATLAPTLSQVKAVANANGFEEQDDDNNSSPGASDTEDDPTENTVQLSKNVPVKRASIIEMGAGFLSRIRGNTNNKPSKEEELQRELEQVTQGLEEPVRKATPPKPKTQQELEQERAQKLLAMKQEEQKEQRLEQERLEREPLIAKAFRKALANANNVLVLLNDVFNGRRFGVIQDSSNELYVEVLEAEAQSNEEAFDSMNLFTAWKESIASLNVPSKINENFDFLGPWEQKLTSLGNLWNEVFQHYIIVEGEVYPFSLQQLEKLRYFFKELNALTTLEHQFSVYMKNTDRLVSGGLFEEKRSEIEKFIATVELFSAKTMTMYTLLDGLKTQMERTNKIRLQLQGKMAALDVSQPIEFTIFDNDKNEDEETSEEKPEWLLRANAAIEAYNNKDRAIQGFEARLSHAQEVGEETKEAQANLTQAKKELVPIEKELKEAQRVARQAIEVRDKARAEAKAIKQAKKEVQAADSAEIIQQQREMVLQLKQVFVQAKTAATQFLTEYAVRPGSAELLTFSQPIQAMLSDVSEELFQLGLGHLQKKLRYEDNQWLSMLLVSKVRELTSKLSITSSGVTPTIEILLKDNNNTMLEVLSIPLNGSARETLTPVSKQSLSERVAAKYMETLKEGGNSLLTIKAGSDVSIHAAKLLEKIRNTKKEYYAHDVLKHMNQATFSILGLDLLLYMQDAPKHNFQTARSAAIPGGGSRFLLDLVTRVQEELGYHLRAGKVIYDAMSKRTPAVEKAATTRSSLFGTKADENAQGSLKILSDHLEYLFEPRRTKAELSSVEAKEIELPNAQAHQLLVDQLMTCYLSDLEHLALAPTSEVNRKRIKRIVKLMEHLPYEKRLPLMNSDVVQLFILRANVESFERSSTGEKSSTFGSVFGKGTRAILKATGVDRKSGKYQFFVAAFVHFKTKFERAKLAVEQETSDTRKFIISFFEAIGSAGFNSENEDIGTWLDKTILQGVETPKALMWLSNKVLNELFDGSSIRAKTIREMQGTSEEAFNTIVVSNNSVEQAVSDISIVSANEFFIVLAYQAAVLEFGKLMLETNNRTIIGIASQHSWFLQLRFLEAILIEKKVLPLYDAQASVPMYKRERDMLSVFDNMMSHIGKLPGWMDTCFKHARTDIRHAVSGMTEEEQAQAEYEGEEVKLGMTPEEKTKLAFVLIAEFFSVIFSALSGIAVSQRDMAAGTLLAELAKHMNGIKKMAGFTLNGDYESRLYSLAVIFLLENPLLLENSRIVSGEIERETIRSVKNADSTLAAYFYSSTRNVGILAPESQKKKQEILSDIRVAFFAQESLPPLDAQENILLADAISRLG